MKAYVLHGIADLKYEDTQIPKLEPGWVLVEVMAAGICGSDIPRIFETGTYHFPTIPGHEFSGIVKEVSSQDDRKWLGKRVGVFPLMPCMKCDSCKQEDYEMCDNYNYLGSRTDGGFGEYVAVPTWNLIELPKEVSFEQGAMLEPMSVALHAIKQLPTEHIQSIAIFGAGPIGLIMAQWARKLEIKQVLLIVNKKQQEKLANQLGFFEVCNQKEVDPIEWINFHTNQGGVDAAVDGVGTSLVLEQCLKSVAPKGNILVVGNPKGNIEIDKNIYWRILRKQLRLYGTWNSKFGTTVSNDWEQSVEALAKDEIDVSSLITHRMSLDNLEKGLYIMKDKMEFYSKVMITKGEAYEQEK